MTLNASRIRCAIHVVSNGETGQKLMMRCHQHCGSATDSEHRQSSGQSGCAWMVAISIHTRGL